MTKRHAIEIELSDAAKARLTAALLGRAYPLGENFEPYIEWARATVADAAPGNLLQVLSHMRDAPTPPGALIVRNGPQDPVLPATPADGLPSLDKETHISEAWLVGVSALLGSGLISFRAEKPSLVNDVVPLAGAERALTNQGSDVELGLHNEQAFLPPNRRVRRVLLAGLRDDHERIAVTPIADVRAALPRLSRRTQDQLRKPQFRFRAPVLHGRPGWTAPAPILTGPDECPELRVTLYGGLTRGINRTSEEALAALGSVLAEVVEPVRVFPGTLLVADNYLAVHGRSAFTPRFDGRDRWLQRVLVGDRWAWREEIATSGRIVSPS